MGPFATAARFLCALCLVGCASASRRDGVDASDGGRLGPDLAADTDGGSTDGPPTLFDLTSPTADGPSGTVDPTFGAVYPSLGSNGGEQAFAVAAQADGRVVAAGWAGSNLSISRYTTSGALDTSFNGTGKMTFTFGSSSRAQGIIVQPDQNIAVAGYGFDTGSVIRTATARITPAGKADTTFAGSGSTLLPISVWQYSAEAFALTQQADGKLVVVGTAYPQSGSDSRVLVLRYTTAGALDTTFGTGGAVITDVVGYQPHAAAVTIQPDGKIVVAGRAAQNFIYALVLRYNTNGTLDTTFNSTGYRVTFFGTAYADLTGVALQSTGRILVSGAALDDKVLPNRLSAFVGALTSSGQEDASFGVGGLSYAKFGGDSDQARAIVIQTDDKPVIAAKATTGAVGQPAVARFTAQGVLDPTFHSTGMVTIMVPGTKDGEANALAIEPAQRLVVAGLVTPTSGTFTQLFVTRLFP